MLHLSAFVSERLSAAVVDICGEVEKTLSLYRVEVSRSREEICLLRQELALLRDNNTTGLYPIEGTSTIPDHAYIPFLQEKGRGPLVFPGSPGAPLEKPEESEDHSVGREFLPGPTEKTCMTQTSNLETPQLKEEQDEFIITTEVGSSPDGMKSEPCNRDEAEFTYVLSPDDDGSEDGSDEKWMMGDERQRSCDKNQTVNMLKVETRVSKIETSKNVCPVCSKAFHYASALVKHIKSHNNKCGVCGKTCASTKELLSHLKGAHSKSHFCHICGRTFSKHCLMIVHARAHTDVREHACHVCGMAFFRKDHLVMHMRTHSGEKPYACDICGKAFSQSQNLTIHRRSHTGEKPYQCSACGKVFSTSSQRNSHMRNQHNSDDPHANGLGKAHS